MEFGEIILIFLSFSNTFYHKKDRKRSMKLKGKVALVTGSSRGIGKSIAEAFAKEGASVILTYKQNKKLADEVAANLQNPLILKMDVTKRTDIKKGITQIIKKYNCLDILVNNAGINKPANFENVTDIDWDLIMSTNLKGPFALSQEIFPIMKRQNYGRIINISSVSGQYGGPKTVHYAVSKAGLIALGHCLARFGAPYNITANNIAPGIIMTDMSERVMKSKAGRDIVEKTLLKRAGYPNEVANLAVFLASDFSSYITGQTFNINGGLFFS